MMTTWNDISGLKAMAASVVLAGATSVVMLLVERLRIGSVGAF
jgi:hypothetical protein